MEELCERVNNMSFGDESFAMTISVLASKQSKDPCTQVGACIVDPSGTVLSSGYNSMPKGFDDIFPWDKNSDDPLKNKHLYVCHAELNAICKTNKSKKDCTIYVTLFPCNECAKLIIQTGITEVVYFSDKHAKKPSTIASKKMFDAVGIKYRPFLPSDKNFNVAFKVIANINKLNLCENE